jgi:hypothetical protein
VTEPESDETAPARPVLRIVRGDPSPEDIAALTVVLTAASGGGPGEPDGGPTSVWTDRESLVRRVPSPGPGAWRTSGWR